MHTAIRTLRLETSKRGKLNAPHHPSSVGSSQKDLYVLIPKELGLLSLEGGMLTKMTIISTPVGKNPLEEME